MHKIINTSISHVFANWIYRYSCKIFNFLNYSAYDILGTIPYKVNLTKGCELLDIIITPQKMKLRPRKENLLEVQQLVSAGTRTGSQTYGVRAQAFHHHLALLLVYYRFMCLVLHWSLKFMLASTRIKNKSLKKSTIQLMFILSAYIYFKKLLESALLISSLFLSKSGRVYPPK